MATGDVTISTFLELRDNLSGGIKSVESQINRLTQAAQQAEDAIKRMKTAQAAKPPKPPAPPAPPKPPGRPGAPGGPREDPFLKFQGGIFSSVVRANLLVDAIEGAVMGATNAITGLLRYTVKVSEEYENAQLNITNTLTSMAVSPTIEAGQRKSLVLMSQMRELAAKLPGEAKDYINAFSLTLPEALASGEKDVKKYAQFVSMYTATALSKGVDAPQAARDLVEMLQGRAHLRTATFQKLRSQIGMLAKDFNRLDPEQRYARITEAIAKAGSGLAMASDTASAKFGELKSRIDEIFIIGGQPFFESVKGAASDLNAMLEKSKPILISIVTILSTELGNALRGAAAEFDNFVDKVGTRVDKFLKIRATTKMMQAGKLSGDPLEATWQYYENVGAQKNLHDRIIKRQKEAAEMQRVAQKYAWTGMPAPVPEIPYSPLMPGATEALMGIRAIEEKFKSLAPVEGVSNFFETFEDWMTYGKSIGLEGKRMDELYDELIKQGAIKLATAPTATRELNVNFNNNRFDIRQAFAEGFDPDRIAVAFASDLGRLGEFQVQSQMAPVGAVY